jgi:hypothetical protein
MTTPGPQRSPGRVDSILADSIITTHELAEDSTANDASPGLAGARRPGRFGNDLLYVLKGAIGRATHSGRGFRFESEGGLGLSRHPAPAYWSWRFHHW